MDNASRPRETGLGILLRSKRIVVSVVLLICVVTLITSNQFWRWMYPIGYQPTIQQAASFTHIDPLLVASVIRVESKFHTHDVSHAGAIGLMQLMPDTAVWIVTQMNKTGEAQRMQITGHTASELSVPNINIQIGTWYIRYLIERFNGNEVAAIAAYNGGPKRVGQWLAQGVWNGQLNTISDIPVGETRHFVDRVFYNYDLYKRIYGRDAAWQQRNVP